MLEELIKYDRPNPRFVLLKLKLFVNQQRFLTILSSYDPYPF